MLNAFELNQATLNDGNIGDIPSGQVNAVSHTTGTAKVAHSGAGTINAVSHTTGTSTVLRYGLAVVNAVSNVIAYRYLAEIRAASTLTGIAQANSIFWEYLESGGVRRGISIFQARPNPDGSYGTTFLYRDNTPTEDVTLTAKAVPYYIVTNNRNVMLNQNVASFTMVDGSLVTGLLNSMSANRIRGSSLYDMTIQVRRTDKSPLPVLQQGAG